MTTTQDSRAEYHGDQPTTEDLLGFREHAQHLADEISHFDPNLPMVVGIEGEWGEGKTSFLLMMEERWRRQDKLSPEWPRLNRGWWWPHKLFCNINKYARFLCESIAYRIYGWGYWVKNSFAKLPREERQIRLVKFDPWWFSGKEKLLERFLDEIKAKEPFYALVAKNMLNSLKDSLSKHRSPWHKFISAIVAAALPFMLPYIFSKITVLTEEELLKFNKMISLALPGLSILTFVLISLLIESLLNFIAPVDMEKKRARLEHKLRRSSVQRIVIVDDIDRLPDDELQELFRVIKSVAAMPNIVYVLLYDRAIVASALDKLHANRGEQFLEKIVQLTNRLPAPTKTANREAAYHILSSLPAMKDLLSQTPINKEHQEGLQLIASSLIPNLRQAKRIANVVKIGYREELAINALLFVFLEALRLHSRDMWLKLCVAMIDYINYPNGTKILLTSKDGTKTTTHLSEAENEWMIKHNLMSPQCEPCPPYAGISEKLIKCIAHFTGLTLPGAKYVYRQQLFYIPEYIDTDDRSVYCSDIFGRYLQTRLDEERLSVECIREELLTLSSTAEMIQFITDRQLKFGGLSINAFDIDIDIKYYLRELSSKELIEQLGALFRLARLAADSAEYVYLSQVKIEFKQQDVIRDCSCIFSCLRNLQWIRKSYSTQPADSNEISSKVIEQQNQLDIHIKKYSPIFYFKFKLDLGLKYSFKDGDDYIKEKRAVLEKYPPEQALNTLLKEGNNFLGRDIFEETLLSSSIEKYDEIFSVWLINLPEKSLELDALLKKWIIASLRRENAESRLPLQPKLAHLIEPIEQELEQKGEGMMLNNLREILAKNARASALGIHSKQTT